MNTTTEKTYETCAETASRLRASLKHNFPGVKFSVRSKTYAGGASIRIVWQNGPSSERVHSVACRFEGADFDGMQDLKTYKTQLGVAADGSIREVHPGADFIFCDRETSPELMAACVSLWRSRWNPEDWARTPDYEHERMAREGFSKLDYIPNDEPVEATAQRAWAAAFGGEAHNA